MTAYSTGTYNLIGVTGFPVTATVDPNSTVAFNLVGALDTFNISSGAGSTVLINNTVDVANILNLNTNGGTIALGTLAGALGLVTATINGGEFVVDRADIGVLNDANISYGSAGGVLLLGNQGTYADIDATSPIIGLTSSADVIDDQSLQFGTTLSYTVSGTGNVQTVNITDDGQSLKFTSQGAHLQTGTFTLASNGPLDFKSDGHGGTTLTVCFVEGTRLSVPGGYVNIEHLKPGDVILTASGAEAPVRWVGVMTVCTAFADFLETMPIRIRAGALAEKTPARDLLVSPCHAMFINGALVQAGALVNGVSIVRETKMPPRFQYYHVELSDHALILAEDAPTETFIDNVDRMAFDNWEEHRQLFGDDVDLVQLEYPRAKSVRQVPAHIQASISRRCVELFGELPNEPSIANDLDWMMDTPFTISDLQSETRCPESSLSY